MKFHLKSSKPKLYFFDTEFAEDGVIIDFISIGIVSEDGDEYYAVSNEFDEESCNDWVKENVLPQLPDPSTWKSKSQIKEEILEFIQGTPQFWANHASYDWIVLCQIFGTMMDLPERYPKYCMDLKQLEVELDATELLPEQEGSEHDALEDARYNLVMYKELRKLQKEK